MIFDDHDVNDDWNISQSSVARCARCPGRTRGSPGRSCHIRSTSIWATCSPPELAEDELFHLNSEETATQARDCRSFAKRCDRESAASRWAYHRDFGKTRLLVIDSRAARVLAPGDAR